MRSEAQKRNGIENLNHRTMSILHDYAVKINETVTFGEGGEEDILFNEGGDDDDDSSESEDDLADVRMHVESLFCLLICKWDIALFVSREFIFLASN